MIKLVINKGHGGNDSGAVGNGLMEKVLTKKIGDLIINKLKDYDIEVKSIQQSGNQSLTHVTNEANKWGADYFLSIHINAGGGTGFESFIYNGNVSRKTFDFRETVHNEIMKSIKGYNVRDRGKKRANFHVLRETKMAAMLSENMFIDTKKDSDLLKDEKFLDKIAQGHVNGIVKYLSLKKKKTEYSDNSTYYRVVVGSYKNRKNAENQQKKLKEKGFDSFLVAYKNRR